MRRRVDLRWRISPQEIDRLRATQLELLNRAAGFLKPGGTLVYSTCSLEPEENEEIVKVFCMQKPGFTLETTFELNPAKESADGAYVASFSLSGDSRGILV
jgi:16S rRNA (cytosine967-C5)-methyltransferase